MKTAVGLIVAVSALGAARLAHDSLDRETVGITDEPFAPSPSSAPILVAGYRELAADLLFVRLTTYFGGPFNTANGIASMVEAIIALDPSFERIYEYGARAMTIASSGIDQRTYLRAAAVLEAGANQFPESWRIPLAAGQMYMVNLQTKDPVLRREWDERGALMLESATRRPGAPSDAAVAVAQLRTKLGQHERAIAGLREMLLVTTDKPAQDRILARLADLEKTNASALAAELFEARRKLDDAWKLERPAVPMTMYFLLGKKLEPGFDMATLATGGHDLVDPEAFKKLEPLE